MPSIRRPDPLRWLWYAYGGGLPARFAPWVLHDTTCRTWWLRHLVRARWRPDADVYETARTIEVTLDLAGVDEDELEEMASTERKGKPDHDSDS